MSDHFMSVEIEDNVFTRRDRDRAGCNVDRLVRNHCDRRLGTVCRNRSNRFRKGCVRCISDLGNDLRILCMDRQILCRNARRNLHVPTEEHIAIFRRRFRLGDRRAEVLGEGRKHRVAVHERDGVPVDLPVRLQIDVLMDLSGEIERVVAVEPTKERIAGPVGIVGLGNRAVVRDPDGPCRCAVVRIKRDRMLFDPVQRIHSASRNGFRGYGRPEVVHVQIIAFARRKRIRHEFRHRIAVPRVFRVQGFARVAIDKGDRAEIAEKRIGRDAVCFGRLHGVMRRCVDRQSLSVVLDLEGFTYGEGVRFLDVRKELDRLLAVCRRDRFREGRITETLYRCNRAADGVRILRVAACDRIQTFRAVCGIRLLGKVSAGNGEFAAGLVDLSSIFTRFNIERSGFQDKYTIGVRLAIYERITR